jgi:alkylation response protein AidB-like acyl-CoA dehydrogenase
MLKVLGTEASQRIDLLALELAADWQGDLDNAPDAIAVAMPRYLNNRAGSIYAGSNEIQRDLIARGVVDQAAA